MPRRNIPVRNPVARSPLLRKGGPHVKSKTGQRVRSRLSTYSAIDEWREELGENNRAQEQENGEHTLPDFFATTRKCLTDKMPKVSYGGFQPGPAV